MSRNRTSGVTLAELAVVLTIVAVLAVFALPSAIDAWQRQTVDVLADRLASALTLARATAARQHAWVHVRALDAAKDWKSGWAISVGSGRQPSPDDMLISLSPPVRLPVTIRPNGREEERGTISYGPMGYSRGSINTAYSRTLIITSGRHARCVIITSTDLVRVGNPATESGSCARDTGDDADS